MTIREELLALHDEHGLLRPQQAVAWARENKDSELYASLEWNDAKAGEEFRIWQVRRLVAIHIVSEKGQRQLLSLSIDRQIPGGGYRTLEAISEKKELRAVLVQDAFDELTRVRLKYEAVLELARVWEEVDRAKEKQAKRGKARISERGKESRQSAA